MWSYFNILSYNQKPHEGIRAVAGEGTPATITALTNATNIAWALDGNPQLDTSSEVNFYLTPTSHTVTATVQSTNPITCTNTTSFQLEVVPAPVIDEIKPTIFCEGDQPDNPSYHVVLSAQPGGSGVYNWSNGMNGANITVLDGGAYQVTLSLGGCTTTRQIQVPNNLKDYAWIFPSGCYEICGPKTKNSPVLIGPRLPFNEWFWMYNGTKVEVGSQSTPSPFTLTDEGNYSLSLYNGYCSLETPPLSFNYKQCNPCELNPPQIEKIDIAKLPYCAFTAEVYFFSAPGTTLTLTAPDNNVVISPTTVTVPPGGGGQQLTIVPISPFAGGGNVEIIAQGLDNKDQTCVYKFNFDLPTCDGGSTSIFGKNGKTPQLVLAPNPAKEQVSLHYNALPEQTQLAIYDLTGRKLAVHEATNTEGIWQLPTNNMPAGVYIVVVQSNGTTLLQQKLIIE